MIQTRNKVFETNSSSCHSITLSKKNYQHDGLYVDPSGVCTVYPMGFGWGPDTHTDAAVKASYCLVWAKANNDLRVLEMLENTIKAVTSARQVVFAQDPTESKYHEWGYIDHQSTDVLSNSGVLDNDESLTRFIFDPKSVLVIDNDNH